MVDQDWTKVFLRGLKGDRQAYALFLSHVATLVRPRVRRSLGTGCNAVEAEDVVQDILLTIHLKCNTWDVTRPAAPWVWGITKHKVIDALRKRGRNLEDATDYAEDFEVYGAVEDSQDHGDAERMIGQLGGREQVIVRRIAMEDATPLEVAQDLQMTEGAVRVALHRALKKLAAIYRKGER